MTDHGQSTVELAMCLPVVVVLVLGVLQVAVVARDQLALEVAARDAARAASVSATPHAAADAAGRVTARTPSGATVDVDVGGSSVTVTVRAPPTRVPLVGLALSTTVLRARATMPLEPP